jgi:hypothetical protein
MQQIIRQHSGGDLKGDGDDDQTEANLNPNPAEGQGTDIILGGEPDNDEEFVFQSLEDDEFSVQPHEEENEGAIPVPFLLHAKSDISTDDNNQDSDAPKDGKRRSKKNAEERYHAGLSGAKPPSRKKKKVNVASGLNLTLCRRKKKNLLVPRLLNTLPPLGTRSEFAWVFNHFGQVAGALCGISLCFELNYLLEGHEKLFGVIFLANIALGNSVSGNLCDGLIQ